MMKKFMKKLWDKKDSQKGFTLVELIVVLVILAILAAIMVPALLGWIDKAKEKQYVLEARNIYMAAQAKASEQYAAGEGEKVNIEADDISDIENLSDVDITSLVVTPKGETAKSRDAFTIKTVKTQFTSSDHTTVYAELNSDGVWSIVTGTEPSGWNPPSGQ